MPRQLRAETAKLRPSMTRIGTPLSSSGFKVMILGSGELGKETVLALQRLGVETIAVDRYPNAPAHQVAHRSYVLNMTDGDALRELIERERPDLVVPEIEAIATDELERLEAKGVCRVIPTARATRLTMNREGIRDLAANQLKLPTSPFAFASSPAELHEAARKIGFPCFVKPTMSSSGKGQSRVDNEDELDAAWSNAASGGRVDAGRVIIEGAVPFDLEITLLTVRAEGERGVESFFCEPIGHLQRAGDYVESWQPQPISELALERAQNIAGQITGTLGGRGIFGVELFVRGDDVWFSEVSPRPHDTGLVTLCTQRQSEFELHARAILGLPVDTTRRDVGASAVIYGGRSGVVAFENVDEALWVPGSDLRLFGKPQAFPTRRMGVALATGSTVEEARERARECAQRVRVVAS